LLPVLTAASEIAYTVGGAVKLYCGFVLFCSPAAMFQYSSVRRSEKIAANAGDTTPGDEEDTNDHQESCIGLFELLPLELKFHFFTYLSGI